jgi:hypothetical protein
MAFTLPELPLACDVYTGPWLSKSLRLSTMTNLAIGRRVRLDPFFDTNNGEFGGSTQSELLFAAHEDIRSRTCAPQNDIVEVPSGSGRWYIILWVEVAGMGFANEHVVAGCVQISDIVSPTGFPGATWPVPMT